MGPRSAVRAAAVGALLVALVIGSSVPTALWPAYQERMGYGAGTTTLVFACYVLALLPATLIAGPAADGAGARPVVTVSVLFAVAGAVTLAVAPSAAWLAAGRLCQGLGVGGAGAPLTAALLAVEPSGNRPRASLLVTALLAAGTGIGPLLSGSLAGSGSLTLPYAATGALLAATAVAALPLLPHGPGRPRPGVRVPRLVLPPDRHARRRLARAAGSSLLVWAIGYAGLAVAPSFAVAVLQRHDPLVVASPAGVLLLVSAGAQVVAGRVGTLAASRRGLAAVIIGLAALAAVPAFPSLLLLTAALAVLGMGHGLVFMGALRESAAVSPPGHDGATSAVFFAATYIGGVLPVLGIGAASTFIGVAPALQAFCATAAAGALALMLTRAPRAAAEPAG